MEVDIRRGLNDTQLRKKHGIPEPTWRRWKTEGEEDRENKLKNSRTDLLDKLREGRETFSKQIENVFVKVALGEWRYVTTTTYEDKSGKIVKTVEKITTKPDFEAAKFLLNYYDPEFWDEHKKPEPPHVGARVPKSSEYDAWVIKCSLQAKVAQEKKAQEKEAQEKEKEKQRAVNPIEYAVIEMALGIRKRVSNKTWKVRGKIIGKVKRTTTLKPNLRAAKYWLSHRDPEFPSRYKESSTSSISNIMPNAPIMSEEEWLLRYNPSYCLQRYGNKQTNTMLYTMLLGILRERREKVLNESRINDLEPDISGGLSDFKPQEGQEKVLNESRSGGLSDFKPQEGQEKVLNESLINDLEPDIRKGLFDYQLRKKHGISAYTWYCWKHKGVIDRNNGLETLDTELLDRLREGRKVAKQIKIIAYEIGLDEGMSASTTTWTDESGKIIETTETIATPPIKLAFKAIKFWQRCRDPENWGK